jgi:hypothetical protein
MHDEPPTENKKKVLQKKRNKQIERKEKATVSEIN